MTTEARALAIVERGCRLLAVLAPRAYRQAWDADALLTIRAACLEAHQRRGLRGLVGQGLQEWGDMARLAARARLGFAMRATLNPEPRVQLRDRGDSGVRRLVHALRFAGRSLSASRTTTVIAILTLAVGIGLSTAVFSILDSVLFRPVPYPDAGRLAVLASFNVPGKFSYAGSDSPALIRAWRAETDLLDRVEAYDRPSFVYATDRGSDMISGAVVTPGLFGLLGTRAEAGRLFATGDGRDGTNELAVVSHGFWRSRLHGDPAAVGRQIVLDGVHVRIIGILPASFRFPSGETEIWLPYDVEQPPVGTLARTLTPLVRLRIGVDRDRAALQVRAQGGRLSASVGESADITAELYPLAVYVDDKTEQSLWILSGAVGFLFLVVCANLANLTLSRSILRVRDFAVLAALGASRRDLVQKTLLENALVAIAGGLAGLAAATGLLRAALVVLPSSMTIGTLNAITLDGRAMTFALMLGLLAALLFGLPAAFVASRSAILTLLSAHSRGSSSSSTSRRLRSALVVVEVSVSIVLLVGAALMTRSFVKLEGAGKGFDPSNLVSIRLGFPTNGFADATLRDRFMLDALTRIRQVPGVAGVTPGGLPTDYRFIMLGRVEFDRHPGEWTPPLLARMHDVQGDYFATLRLPLLRGRTFRGDDTEYAVIINDQFAHRYWPDGNALGGRFRAEGQPWQTVIGIAGDVRTMAADQPGSALMLYYQMGKAPQALRPMLPASSIVEYRTIVVRATRPAVAVSELPQIIHDVDPRVVIWRTALVEELYADAIARPRTVFVLMVVFAGVGLVLAMAGVYGVLSYLVTQRLREIGIRLALGARPRDVGSLILTSGLGLTAVGLTIGIGLALALARVMRTLLYQVDPMDPLSIVGVSTLLTATALAAASRPARRAMRVDPVSLLREE